MTYDAGCILCRDRIYKPKPVKMSLNKSDGSALMKIRFVLI